MNQQELLAQLKSIHPPKAISMRPQGILYILLLLILLWCFFTVYKIFCDTLKYRRKKQALTQLSEAVKLYKTKPAQAVANISILLRRIALTTHNPREVASLSNKEWLNFLDKHIQTKEFSQGVGQVLLTAPYQKNPAIDIENLEKLIKLWIGKVL